jgi:very-short-patch-repair endonuclease
MPASSLPPELRRSAIRTSTADDHTVTRWRLRANDVQHPYRGVSSWELDLTAVRDLATGFLPIMEPGQTFSHTTALALHGAPVPRMTPELHITVAFPRTPPRRPGIRGHSLATAPAMLLDGMPVAPPLIAWAQSAPLLAREDLVAVGDHLVLDVGRRALGTLAQLELLERAWRGRPGAARLAWAVPRIRPGVRSRPETHLRLLLVRSRLSEPVVAHPVRVAGGITLHPDLAYPTHKLALEYEGFDHFADQRVVEVDIERRELLAEAGWRTIRVTAPQLYGDPARLVARVRRHLAA